jgi:hypothetical protein
LAQLDRTKNLINTNVRDALVIGYESRIPTLELPDLSDRHVLAAAIQSRADFIVTFNLKDFPTSVLANYGVAAIHPDDFILDLGELALILHLSNSIASFLKQCFWINSVAFSATARIYSLASLR